MNKLLLILLLFLLLSYPVYALSFQDVTNFFGSIFNSIASFFKSAFSVLTPSATGGGGGGGGSPSSGSSGGTLCSSSLSLSITGKDTCTVTAIITSSNCANRTYEIKDGGSKCNGNITSSSFTKTCTWTVTSGSYTYNLYIDGQYKLSKSVSCAKTPPPACSDGTLYDSCSSTKPKYCSGGTLINGCGSPYNCRCPSGQTCNATTEACYTPLKCSDGTLYSQCSSNKPKYCDNGNLINACGSPYNCGCPSGQSCNTTTESCYTPTVSTCDSQCKSNGYVSGTCKTSCQSGETSIGQDGCPSGQSCCCGAAPTSIKVDFHTGSGNFGEYDATTIANTFGMSQSWWVGSPPSSNDYTVKMNQVHALNPNYKALVYRNLKDIYDYWTDEWNLANNSGWLLKNASGSYLRSPTWPENYLVDITNPDYQKWVANTIKSWINQYPFFDGVFADNSIGSDAWEWTWDSTSRPINPKTGTYFTDEEIRNAYIQLHREIKNAIGSKTLVCNGIWNGNRFYERFSSYNEIISNSPLDGIMSEGLWYADGGSWFSEDDWLNSLKFLVWIQDNFLKDHLDRFFIGVFYSTGTLPQGCTQEQMTLYGFASTLLGAKNSQNYALIGSDVYKYPNLLAFVQKLRNIDIGYSENDYYVISGTHVYARDFANSKVLVNPSTSSYTINLGGSYKTLDGTTVSSVTMNAHTGEILLKA